MDKHRLIDIKTACDRENKSRSSIYREIANGTHPKPVKIGARKIAFVEAEIDDLIAGAIAERDRSSVEAA
jgi:prophage regulatory protein